MKKIIVLDYSYCVTHIFDFDENLYDSDDIQAFYDVVNEKYNLGLKESECEWMSVENVEIEYH